MIDALERRPISGAERECAVFNLIGVAEDNCLIKRCGRIPEEFVKPSGRTVDCDVWRCRVCIAPGDDGEAAMNDTEMNVSIPSQ